MTYLHLDTLTQATLHEIRAAHPQVSIPDGADLAHLGYAPLTLTDQPEVEDWHIAEPGAPEQGADGWHTTWVVRRSGRAQRCRRSSPWRQPRTSIRNACSAKPPLPWWKKRR
jgi:hypothetical protein